MLFPIVKSVLSRMLSARRAPAVRLRMSFDEAVRAVLAEALHTCDTWTGSDPREVAGHLMTRFVECSGCRRQKELARAWKTMQYHADLLSRECPI